MAELVGDRILLIRQALGSVRDPLALEKLSKLVRDQTGHFIDKSELSRMERGKQGVSLADIDALARVDPLKRGKTWLAWGDEPGDGGASDGEEFPPPKPIESAGEFHPEPGTPAAAKKRRRHPGA